MQSQPVTVWFGLPVYAIFCCSLDILKPFATGMASMAGSIFSNVLSLVLWRRKRWRAEGQVERGGVMCSYSIWAALV